MLLKRFIHDVRHRDTFRTRREASPSLASRINTLKPLIPLT